MKIKTTKTTTKTEQVITPVRQTIVHPDGTVKSFDVEMFGTWDEIVERIRLVNEQEFKRFGRRPLKVELLPK